MLGKLLDLFGEGGREKHALALIGQQVENPPDIRQKAHIQHPVCFIQYQDFNIVQPGMAVLDMVQQTSWAGNNDLYATAEGIDLLAGFDAAVNGGTA